MQALLHLKKNCDYAFATIALVDNAPDSDWNLDLFNEHSESCRSNNIKLELLRGHGNIGFGRGHNLAILTQSSDLHLVLNPDVDLEPASLTEGVKYLLANSGVAIVSPFAIGPDGQKQFLCKSYPALLTLLVRGFAPAPLKGLFKARLAHFEMHQLPENAPSRHVPIASGCFMLCRTNILKSAGGFNPEYFLYFEDFDLSLRIGKVADIAYVPSVRISHAGGHAAKKGIWHLWLFARSAFKFYNTHGWRFFGQK